MVYVKKLDWEEWNVKHIKKHTVVVEEVEQVCHGKHVTRLGKEGRLLIIGPTQSGRMLVVILSPTAKKNVYYPVTARPADKQEIRDYKNESR